MPHVQDDPTDFLFKVDVGGEGHVFRLRQSKADGVTPPPFRFPCLGADIELVTAGKMSRS